MSSSIRNTRDTRNTMVRREYRDTTTSGEYVKVRDSKFTSKSSNFVPPAMDGMPSRTDQKVDHVNNLVKNQLAPMIQTMSRNAVLTDRYEFYYYKRKRTGRRCSCFLYETSPSSSCQICYGTGIVGGYDKHNCCTEVIDFTYPMLNCVNVETTMNEDTKPIMFKLSEGATFGYIEATIPIRKNIGKMDTYLLCQPIFNHGVKLFAISPTNVTAQILKVEDFEPFLDFNEVRIRIEINRGDSRPYVSHLFFRYVLNDNLLIYGDTIRAEENLQGLSPVGIIDAYQELDIFFDARMVYRYDNEDLLYRIMDARKFKIVSVKENRLAGGSINSSNDVKARYLIPDIDTALINILI